jgi:uncharacterized protein with von Willebrand factor type A (vWA) domain
MNQLILYDLFAEIRADQQGVTPGLEEYYLFLDLLAEGYPMRTFDDLAFVLETIWLKSHNQKEKFRQMLEKRREVLMAVVNMLQATVPVIQTPGNDVKAGGTENGKDTEVKDLKAKDGNDNDPNVPKKIDGEEQLKKEDKTPPSGIPGDDEEEIKFSLGDRQAGYSGLLQFDQQKNTTPLQEIPYLFTNDYFPVNNRNMRQAWRNLKDKKEGTDTDEIDIRLTIDKAAEQGYFSDFYFEKTIINQVKLFVFIDRSESMVAVEEFGRELCNTAKLSEIHERLKPLYFYELPQMDAIMDDYIVVSEDWTKSFRIKKLFSGLNKKNIVVMIYSDAGSLKNNYDEERIEKTRSFINYLHQQTAYIAWLNPAPKNRWKETNAAPLSNEVRMFETERRALESAIEALKGKLTVNN